MLVKQTASELPLAPPTLPLLLLLLLLLPENRLLVREPVDMANPPLRAEEMNRGGGGREGGEIPAAEHRVGS